MRKEEIFSATAHSMLELNAGICCVIVRLYKMCGIFSASSGSTLYWMKRKQSKAVPGNLYFYSCMKERVMGVPGPGGGGLDSSGKFSQQVLQERILIYRIAITGRGERWGGLQPPQPHPWVCL